MITPECNAVTCARRRRGLADEFVRSARAAARRRTSSATSLEGCSNRRSRQNAGRVLTTPCLRTSVSGVGQDWTCRCCVICLNLCKIPPPRLANSSFVAGDRWRRKTIFWTRAKAESSPLALRSSSPPPACAPSARAP